MLFRDDPGARSMDCWSVIVHLVRRGPSDHSEGSEIDVIEIMCGPKPMQKIRSDICTKLRFVFLYAMLAK